MYNTPKKTMLVAKEVQALEGYRDIKAAYRRIRSIKKHYAVPNNDPVLSLDLWCRYHGVGMEEKESIRERLS